MTGAARDDYIEGVRHLSTGNLTAATASFEAVLLAKPSHAEALHYLGVIAFQNGQTSRAIELMQAAVQSQPSFADAERNLGTALMSAGRMQEAEQALRRAIASQSQRAAYHYNLGNILAAQRKNAEAAQSYRKALSLQPNYPEALSNLGTAYRDLDDLPAATACFEQAVAQQPGYVEAIYNLANAYRDLGHLIKAETTIRRGLALKPDYAKAHNTLGNILSDSARSAEALETFGSAARLDPHSAPVASNYLSCLQYLPGIDSARLNNAHRQWARAFANSQTSFDFAAHDRSPDRPLNIGFLSPDFGQHPCGVLSVRLFENLDPAMLRPIVFSTRPIAREDAISKRIAGRAEWRHVKDLTDDKLAQNIRDAKIDILIDMSGHTAGHRLGVFAKRPAPIQISWAGYVGTTGLQTMDYVIADRWHAPEDQATDGPESFLRLTDGYICFDPPIIAPPVAPLPALANGYMTFGCLNNPAKLNDDVIASFAAILSSIPSSRLLLRFRGLDDAGVKARVLNAFKTKDIASERITIQGAGSHGEFLATYNAIDIALDTFPYSGGLTTCEALWMGVPVVTFPGKTFAGRHATSHLSNAGLADFVAKDRAGFERLAVAKAADLQALSTLKAGLRDKVAASPLCDGPRFAASFSAAMRQVWKT
ncbi:MAG: tetratricopeptide repeat protein [Rhodospirillaceae bacterium]|nr:tetratricopeptide repeat protein [Rhodospirillaceae bacterium]